MTTLLFVMVTLCLPNFSNARETFFCGCRCMVYGLGIDTFGEVMLVLVVILKTDNKDES